MSEEMKPCRFTWDGEKVFNGFSHGSTWNGFDNVAVTKDELVRITEWFTEHGKDFPDQEAVRQGNEDMLAIEPMENGLISLGWGYATQIVTGGEETE